LFGLSATKSSAMGELNKSLESELTSELPNELSGVAVVQLEIVNLDEPLLYASASCPHCRTMGLCSAETASHSYKTA
jgi:hypothetical protein